MKQLVLSFILAVICLSACPQTAQASTIPHPEAPVAFIELLEIPAQDIDTFILDWQERATTIGQTPGYISATLYRSLLPGARYQVIAISQWQSHDAWAATKQNTEHARPNSQRTSWFARPTAWSANTYNASFQKTGELSDAPKSAPLQRAQKDPAIKSPELPFVFINLMEMDAKDIDPFVLDWQVRSKIMGQMPAAIGSTLYRSVLPANTFQIVNVSQWQSYSGFIDANNDPAYAQKLGADLSHTPSIKLIRGFYRPVAAYTHIYGGTHEN